MPYRGPCGELSQELEVFQVVHIAVAHESEVLLSDVLFDAGGHLLSEDSLLLTLVYELGQDNQAVRVPTTEQEVQHRSCYWIH